MDSLRVCHPCHFCREPLDMVFLFFKYILRNEQGECAIPHPDAFDLLIEPILNFFPDKERGRLYRVSGAKCSCAMRLEAQP